MPVSNPLPALIDEQSTVDSLCAAIDVDALLPIDTEFMRTNQFAPRLCLLQVAANGMAHCVDELAEIDTTPLWQLLCAGRGLRVLHAGKQDLEVAWVRHRCLPQPLFDTQIGAALIGEPAQVGYAGLVKTLLDRDVDKSHTRADWTRRPLGPELIAYACGDVQHLPEIYALLAERLTALGRYAWALEDSAALVDPGLYEVNPAEAWQRLGGINRWPVAVQLRARRLARWREEYAMRADRPRQWILGDKSLVDISMRRPRDEAELAACAEVAPGVARRQAEPILAELAAADREFADGSSLVQESRAELVPPEQLKRLGRVVEEIAKGLGLAPEILATRRDLTAALRGEQDIRPMSGWRRAVVGEPLLAAARSL